MLKNKLLFYFEETSQKSHKKSGKPPKTILKRPHKQKFFFKMNADLEKVTQQKEKFTQKLKFLKYYYQVFLKVSVR